MKMSNNKDFKLLKSRVYFGGCVDGPEIGKFSWFNNPFDLDIVTESILRLLSSVRGQTHYGTYPSSPVLAAFISTLPCTHHSRFSDGGQTKSGNPVHSEISSGNWKESLVCTPFYITICYVSDELKKEPRSKTQTIL